MKVTQLDPPGNNGDLGTPELRAAYGKWLSDRFDVGVNSVKNFLAAHGGGTCQFYNPVTHGSTDPDLPPSAGDITWNGFPKRFLSTGPGQPTRYADAEPPPALGEARPQDEYLEWFAHRNAAGRITRVDFTCEAWDYFEFLAANDKARLLSLYRQLVSPAVKEAELFSGSTYDIVNRWNTTHGAMHLTHDANNLFAEVFLAASATVRRKKPDGTEYTASIPLINCARYGDPVRNSDPNIGAAVNGLAREKRMVTLANPVGLYISSFDGAGVTLDGSPAGHFFRVVRGALPLGLRAVFEVPPAQVAAGKTVSDVRIDGQQIEFGGQLAQRITMHLLGVASAAQAVVNQPTVCGAIPQASALLAVGSGAPFKTRAAE